MKRFLMTILALLVLGYIGFCLFLYFNQDRLLFFPTRMTEPELQAFAREEGFEMWRDPAGTPIGWKSQENANAQDVLLVFHGNGGFALHRNYAAFRRSPIPMQIFLLEYPGYGARPGTPSADAFIEAAVEALDAIEPSRHVFILGQSLGSGIASAVAARRPDRIAGIVLLTPFDSLASAASSHYRWLPVSLLIRHRLDSDKNLSTFPGPVAFIVAEEDRTVPAALGLRLYENYPGRKRLWLIPGAHHNQMDALLADWPAIIGWLQSPAQ